MNDETHDSGSASEAADGVLRPFTPPEQPPLPPVEPSKVVPAPPAVAKEVPGGSSVPPPPPVDALADDPWSPASEKTAETDDAPVAAGAVEHAENVDHSDKATEVDAPEVEPEPVSAAASVPPPAAPARETVTLPRKPFLIGLGLLLGAVAVFAALWQVSGGDAGDADADVAAPPGDERIVGDAPDLVDGSGTDDPVESVPTDDAPVETIPVDTGLADDLAAARAEIVSLESVVQTLEERPPPALAGTLIRRIVIGADAKFVSALPESVAVVGAFGGLSLIDPETNRVVANGNVANAATRVLRTASSVWLTNYSDNQLLRVDPANNTVVATFPFEGPDGIDKDGDTIVVASFDGEFVARVNPNNGEILQQVDVGGKPTEVISHTDHGLWAAVFDTGELVEIDRESFEILQRVTVGQGPVGISAGPSFLWVTNHDEGTVAKLDPVAGEVVFAAPVGNGPTESTVFEGSAWVTVTDDGTLVEVSGGGEILSVTPLGGANAGGGPTGIAESAGTLWVAMQGEQSVVRIDLR